jgi:8-oxo-dGTP diphosphatase
MPLAVCGFCFDPTERWVALIRKTRPDWQVGFLNGIGGKLEYGEIPTDAMVREFREEAGALVSEWDLFCVHHDRANDFEVYYFRAKGDLSQCKTTTDEEICVVRVEDVPTLKVVPNLQWLIPMALDKSVELATTVWNKNG